MNKKIVLALAAFIVAGAIYFLGKRPVQTPTESPADSPTVVESPAPVAAAPSSTPIARKTELSAETLRLNEKVTKIAPTVANYREDVKKNPHATANSLRVFSVQIDAKYEAAKDSPEKARELLHQLKDCVKGVGMEDVPAARGICLTYVRYLAKDVPAVADDANEVWTKADPALKRLVPESGFSTQAE